MQMSSVLAQAPTEESSSLTVPGATTPWSARVMVLAALFILVGIVWDISWHSTIGRDTFWTPAHICIHIGGSLGGLVSGWLILRTTLAESAADKAAAVRLWGFYGPLGAWVTVWGALAMLTSAPFDDWWHNAYGLDVKILSPPHSILAAGMFFHVVGGLLLVLAVQNRSEEASGAATGRWLFALAAGIKICLATIMVTEESLPNLQHSSGFYQISCGLYPFYLVALGRACKLAWPATTIAGIYMGLMCAAVWILPLFPAQPMLAPIYNPLKHMAPPAFPLLLVVPALGLDLIFRAVGRGRGFKRDLLITFLSGTAFTGLFLAAQWNFSKYLISPEAMNWFFGGCGFFTFADGPGPDWHQFWRMQSSPLTAAGVRTAWVLAVASSGIGLVLGNWLAKVRR
ncbi:MAG TPA: hypothetical protein VNU68_15255 [Verrucomicrobiae bacterium]|nr:hypothetical protein [Verrucomicrobiae bacterium]